MKTLYEKEAFDELIVRVRNLTPECERQWGKMSPAQAMEHCARALDVATGRDVMTQAFLGKLLASFVKKKFMGETPMPKNAPTGPTLVVKDEPDFDATQNRLCDLITDFHNRGESAAEGIVHGFFGPLSGKEWGETQYKHVDHHLQQFGC
jgi:hypothetical protein